MSAHDPIFISRCRTSIEVMRQHGVNETLIGVVLAEVRSAAVSELILVNPPRHFAQGEMEDALPKVGEA